MARLAPQPPGARAGTREAGAVLRSRLIPMLAGALLLAGCAGGQPAAPPSPQAPSSQAPSSHAHGSSAPSSAAPTGNVPGSGHGNAAFNAADVMFLQMMIPHHGQAVEIAKLARTKATRKEIRELAAAVEATQNSEAAQMTAWLREWNQPTTVDTNPDAHAHHGGMPATSPEVIAALAKRSGPEFDKDAVNLLTGHQHGAVAMARTELRDGSSQRAKDLADRIVKSRTAQIQQLLALLGQ